METVQGVPSVSEIMTNLMRLNIALTIYRKSPTPEARDIADVQFANLHDWFVRHNLPLKLNKETKRYYF